MFPLLLVQECTCVGCSSASTSGTVRVFVWNWIVFTLKTSCDALKPHTRTTVESINQSVIFEDQERAIATTVRVKLRLKYARRTEIVHSTKQTLDLSQNNGSLSNSF